MYYSERGVMPSAGDYPLFNFDPLAAGPLSQGNRHVAPAPIESWNSGGILTPDTSPYFSCMNGEAPQHIISGPGPGPGPGHLTLPPCSTPTNQSACSQDPIMAKVKDEPPDWSVLQQESSSCSSSCALVGDNMAMNPPTPTPPQSNVKVKQEAGANSKSDSKARSSPNKTANGNIKQEKLTDTVPVKKKRDRFNGMSEDEVMKRTLPDHLREGLDIVIVGINPGLTAAYVGHHYAGPGNHFWKCLYLSGLIPEPMNAYDDYKLLELGIGFTNIVERCSRGSADLTRKEIKEGGEILRDKINKFKPKIAVFNGKGIYEIFCGHKNFYIGRQPEPFPSTETAVFVMPSSSARCSQLPRAVDKVPFYIAVKKLRDYLSGITKELVDADVIFPDLELKVEPRKDRVEGGVKTEKKKTATKRKKKGEVEEEGVVDGMYGQMPGQMAGGWQNGSLAMPSIPTSQVPTMDAVFNGTPTLVKSEDTHELSNYGLYPNPQQFENPAFASSAGFSNGGWSTGNNFPPITSQQHMTLPGGGVPSEATPPNTSGSFPMFSYAAMNYQNGQAFDSSPQFLTHPGTSNGNLNAGPPANYSQYAQYNGHNPGPPPGFMGGYMAPPGS